MNQNLQNKVIDQQIAGIPMEQALSELIERVDKGQIEKEKCDMQIAAYKQLNNRHKNVIDAYRVINKYNEVQSEQNALQSELNKVSEA